MIKAVNRMPEIIPIAVSTEAEGFIELIITEFKRKFATGIPVKTATTPLIIEKNTNLAVIKSLKPKELTPIALKIPRLRSSLLIIEVSVKRSII